MNRLRTRRVRNRRAYIQLYRRISRTSSSQVATTRRSPNLRRHLDRRWSPTTRPQGLHNSIPSRWSSPNRLRWSWQKPVQFRTSLTLSSRAACCGSVDAAVVSSPSSAPVSKNPCIHVEQQQIDQMEFGPYTVYMCDNNRQMTVCVAMCFNYRSQRCCLVISLGV